LRHEARFVGKEDTDVFLKREEESPREPAEGRRPARSRPSQQAGSESCVGDGDVVGEA
jgi:hypothetical protein